MANITTKTGIADQTKTKAQLLVELNELRQRVAQLEAAERSPVETELPNYENWFRLSFETTHQGIWQVDPQGNILSANQSIARMLGYPMAELVGRSLFDFVDESDLSQYRAIFRNRQRGQAEQVELRLRRKDGSDLWVLLSATPVVSDHGELLFSVDIFTDLTERKQAEQAVRESEARFRAVLANNSIVVFDQDRDLRYTHLYNPNPNFTVEGVIGKTDTDLFLPADAAQLSDIKQRVLATGVGERQVVPSTLGGKTFYYDLAVEPKYDTSGQITGVSCAAMDITERKQAEQALRESEARFHNMFTKHAAVMLLVEPLTGQIIDANLAAAEFYGYQVSQLCTMNIDQLNMLTPDQILLERQNALNEKYNYFAFPHRLANGEIRTVEVHSSPIALANQSILFSIIHDITERQQAEAALLESQDRLALTIQGAELGTWDWHVPSGHVIFNERWAGMLGFTLAEIEPTVGSWEKLLHPDEVSVVMAAVNAHLQGHTPLYQTEHRLRSKSGEWKWVLATGKVFERDAQGQPVRMVGTHQDITERKQAEEELRRSEAIQWAVLEAIPDFMFWTDLQGNYISFHEFKPVGLAASNRAPVKKLKEALPQNIAEGILSRITLAYETGDVQTFEYSQSLQGEIRYYEAHLVNTLLDEILCTLRDITARRQAEEALRASEQKLRQIIEHSGDGIMLSDETGQIVEWNPALEQITGLRRADAMGRPSWEVLFNLVPEERRMPASNEYVKAASQSYFQTGQDLWVNQVAEFELQRPDGSYRDIQTVDFPTKTEKGFGRGSVIRDVTERKQAERVEAAQLAVSQVLVGSPEAATGLSQVLETIASRLGWQSANLWRLDSSGSRLIWQEGWYGSDQPELAEFEQFSPGYTFEPGEGLTGTVWQTGQAIWDQDLHLVKGAPAALTVGLHSATGIPIIRDGMAVGVMTFFSHSARPLDERLLVTLTDLGQQIGQFLAHKEAEAALRESRERLELVLEAAELGMWDTHLPRGEVVYNERWAEMLGYSLADLEPQLSTWLKLIHPDDLARVREILQTHLAGHTPNFQIEHRMQTKSGEWKWVLDAGKVVERDEQGQPVRTVGIHLDISARKAAEEFLRRYEQMVATSPDWLSLVDRDYVYQIVNQTYSTLHNKSYDQIVSHSVAELLGEAVFMEVVKPYLDQALAGETVQYQAWFDFPTAGRCFINVTYAPYQEKDGTISGVMMSGRDITEAKLLEEHLQQAQKMETVGQLAAGLAHHYNSMLTGIIGFTSLSLHTLPPGDSLAKNLQRVLQTAERMAVLVRQLLAFAQKQFLQLKTVNLNGLVLQLQGQLTQMAPAPIEFALDLDPAVGQVKVDLRQFEYLLQALISNARDAMPQGGRLTLTTTPVSLGPVEAGGYDLTPGDYVLLTVKDTGIGLTDEVKAHLFEPFFTTKEVGQGTGLGLAMSLGIAKQHGGHLLAESQAGQGATFMLYLPCLAPPAPPSPQVQSAPAQTILLVEAEPMVREFVAEILSDQGYVVLKATSDEVALQLIAGWPEVSLQLLLTPIHSNSQALIEQLKTNSPGLKVIFLIDELEELPQERVDFLLKPFTPSGLIQKVRAVLEAIAE